MLETSKSQIEKLDGVYKHLKIIADDLIEKKGLKPDIKVFFDPYEKKISAQTGKKNTIKFRVVNNGSIMAERLTVDIFFPKEISHKNFDGIIEDGAGEYSNMNYVRKKLDLLDDGYNVKFDLIISIDEGCHKDLIIRTISAYKSYPRQEGELIITPIA